MQYDKYKIKIFYWLLPLSYNLFEREKKQRVLKIKWATYIIHINLLNRISGKRNINANNTTGKIKIALSQYQGAKK